MGHVNPTTGVFHRQRDCAGAGTAMMAASDAKEEGFDPCGVCCNGKWSYGVNYSNIVNKDIDDLTREELRLKISREVGLTPPYTHFGKRDLNALFAHKKGQHLFPKRDYNTGKSPDLRMIRGQVGFAFGLEDYDPGRPFRRSELQTICEQVVSESDKRLEAHA